VNRRQFLRATISAGAAAAGGSILEQPIGPLYKYPCDVAEDACARWYWVQFSVKVQYRSDNIKIEMIPPERFYVGADPS
jgi:hypothetical protein